jgi:hypothetical protein
MSLSHAVNVFMLLAQIVQIILLCGMLEGVLN